MTRGVAGIGATLLSACGPQVAPPAATTAPAAPSAPTAPAQAAPAAPTAPAAQPAVAAKNGGTFNFTIWTDDPPSLDPFLNVSFRTQELAAFFYSRLLMSKKAPGVSAQA